MKLIIKSISITYILIIILTAFMFYANASSDISTKDILIDNVELNNVIEFNDVVIKEKDDKIFIEENKKLNQFDGNIIDFYINDKCFILLYNVNHYEVLVVTDKTCNQYNVYDFSRINKICAYDGYIYLVGNNNDNLKVIMYDEQLNIFEETSFEGDGFQEGTELFIYDDYIYVGGIKSAHTMNEHFLNVGNKGDYKSFIFKFELDLTLIDSCYFNDGYQKEEIISITSYNGNISVLIKGDNKYVYELDENLDTIRVVEVNKNVHMEMQTLKKENAVHLYLTNVYNEISIIYYNNNHEEEKLVNIPGRYISNQYINGVLTIYYIYGEKTYKQEINEYHINYLHDLVCDYYNTDETRTNHFSVDSYFEDLKFELNTISPYFSKNISGEYIATYKAKKENGEYISIDTNLLVKNYSNIVNNGVYKLGSRLYYFGNATMNGTVITNGYSLSSEGIHQLEITDVNGNKQKFTIYVVDGYYNDSMDNNLETTYVIEYGSILFLELNTTKKIKNLYLDNNKLGKICLKNNKQYLEISNNYTPGIAFYSIKRIEFIDGSILDIDHTFSVTTKRQEISYNITEYEDDDKLVLDIDINDLYANIKDVYVTVKNNNNILYTKSTFCKNINDVVNIENSNLVTFDVVLSTKDHTDEILFTYVGEGEDLGYIFDFTTKDQRITNIKFTLDLSDHKLKHSKMLISGTEVSSLSSKYQTKKSNIMWYISIILSVGVLCGFGGYFLIRKYLKKKKGL